MHPQQRHPLGLLRVLRATSSAWHDAAGIDELVSIELLRVGSWRSPTRPHRYRRTQYAAHIVRRHSTRFSSSSSRTASGAILRDRLYLPGESCEFVFSWQVDVQVEVGAFIGRCGSMTSLLFTLTIIMRESPQAMDWLSRLLDIFPMSGRVNYRCFLGAPWRLDNQSLEAGEMHYHIVLGGSAVLEKPGSGPPLRLVAGDILLLPRGTAQILHDGSGVESVPTCDRVVWR
jgi:hypothetical protein